jgi:heme exporter protein D
MVAFFEMGGYGSFIWLSYGVTFVALIYLFLASWQREKNAAKDLQDAGTPKQN